MLIALETIALCFVLLIVCVIGIAPNGPVGLVTFYEQDVQDRVVELGLVTKDDIKKQTIWSSVAIFIPAFVLVPLAVYLVNGAQGFLDAWLQMTAIGVCAGLFDRIFIDWWWVGHTKAWIIPGTEDLMPYIAGKTLIGKWVGTLISFPLVYAIIAWVVSLVA